MKGKKGGNTAFHAQRHKGIQSSVKENPFDKIANAKKKHDVLNRKVKGEDRNVGKARAKAVEERNQKLLRDYQNSKKKNVIIDKRFGEDDPTMSLEEKMFLRYQKEKVKSMRRSYAFNLDSGMGDTETLTHKGQVLGKSNIDDRDWVSSDDEAETNGALNKEVVNSLHFGGGLELKRQNTNSANNNLLNPQSGGNGFEEGGTAKRGRLDALQEIVMKSKLHKMERKEAKEEQEEERDKLDKEYDDLINSALLNFAKPGERREAKSRVGKSADASGDGGAGAGGDDGDGYDLSLREMAYEARLQATERTKSAEELALEAQERIEKLEAARLRRMKGLDVDEEEAGGGGGSSGAAVAAGAAGTAAGGLKGNSGAVDRFGNTIGPDGAAEVVSAKRRVRTDDEIDDDFFGAIAAGGGKNKKKGRAEAAAEADKMAAAYSEYIRDTGDGAGNDMLLDEEYSDSSGEEEDEEEEEEEEEEEDSDEDGDDGKDEEDKQVEEGDDDNDDGIEDDDSGANEDAEDGDSEPGTQKSVNGKHSVSFKDDPSESSKRTSAAASNPTDVHGVKVDKNGVNLEMPHKIECPTDLQSFDELMEEYVRNTDTDFYALIDRILAWNSVHLPGTRGQENRSKMHNFLDILVKVFIRTGDALAATSMQHQQIAAAVSDSASGSTSMAGGKQQGQQGQQQRREDEVRIMKQLDYLSGVAFAVSQEIGEIASGALWGRTIKILHAQLQKRLRDYAQGQREVSCWPSLGRLLLLGLTARLFSVTDLRNDVTASAALFLCQCLAQCPVTCCADLASGLLTCATLVEYHAETKRYVPEVTAFLNTATALLVSNPAAPEMSSSRFQGTFKSDNFMWIRGVLAQANDNEGDGNGKTTEKSANKSKKTKRTETADDDVGAAVVVAAAGPAPSTIPWSCFTPKLKRTEAVHRTVNVAAAFLNTLYSLIRALIDQHNESPALPEILEPLVVTLRAVRPQDIPKFPGAFQQSHLQVLERALQRSEEVRRTRVPLQWRTSSVVSIEMKAPRFDLDYSFKKDHDPDQDRVKVKQLSRQLKREHRAAMRELRRDSDFLDQQRHKEASQAQQDRKNERHKNFAWMEQQQATVNQQVRMGKGLMKGGGTGAVKKARVKRL